MYCGKGYSMSKSSKKKKYFGLASNIHIGIIHHYLIILFFIAFCLWYPNISEIYAGDKFEVLVLNSYHEGFEWTDRIMAGIRRHLPSRIWIWN